MSWSFSWLGGVPTEGNDEMIALPSGCCKCSDCNGPDSITDCFWNNHKERARDLGFVFGTNPNFTSLSQGESDREYYSAVFGEEDESKFDELTVKIPKPPEQPKKNNKKNKKKKKRSVSITDTVTVDGAAELEEQITQQALTIKQLQKQCDVAKRQHSLLQKKFDLSKQREKNLEDKLDQTRLAAALQGAAVSRSRSNSRNPPPPTHSLSPSQAMLNQTDYNFEDLSTKIWATKTGVTQFVESNDRAKPQVKCFVQWMGKGSPYLLFLARSAHVIVPRLISFLTQSEIGSRMTLVGACAWNNYLSVPLDSEDVDFAVSNTSTSLMLQVLTHAVVETLKCPDVQFALTLLEAVTKESRHWQNIPSEGMDDFMKMNLLDKAIHQAQNSVITDISFYQGFLRIVPNANGHKIQLSHRTLIDLCQHADIFDTTVPTEENGLAAISTVSAILPTVTHWDYGSPVNPVIKVASPIQLLRYLKKSLESTNHWRIRKDLPRVRFIAQEVYIHTTVTRMNDRKPSLLGLDAEGLCEGFEALLSTYDSFGSMMLNYTKDQHAHLDKFNQVIEAKNSFASGPRSRCASLSEVVGKATKVIASKPAPTKSSGAVDAMKKIRSAMRKGQKKEKTELSSDSRRHGNHGKSSQA